MFKFLVLLALPALFVAQGSFEHALGELFNFLDTDHSEHVTQAEASAAITLLDFDNSGSVSRTEFNMALALNPAYAGHEDALFSSLDVNGDGVIDAQDQAMLFSNVDADGDGTISRGEWLGHHGA